MVEVTGQLLKLSPRTDIWFAVFPIRLATLGCTQTVPAPNAEWMG